MEIPVRLLKSIAEVEAGPVLHQTVLFAIPDQQKVNVIIITKRSAKKWIIITVAAETQCLLIMVSSSKAGLQIIFLLSRHQHHHLFSPLSEFTRNVGLMLNTLYNIHCMIYSVYDISFLRDLQKKPPWSSDSMQTSNRLDFLQIGHLLW